MLSSKRNSTKPDRLARWVGIGALLTACAVQADAEIGGWREAVLSVSNLDTWEQTLMESGGWETLLRAEGDPELLERVTREALQAGLGAEPGLRAELEHLERFRPAPPVPVHRIADPAVTVEDPS